MDQERARAVVKDAQGRMHLLLQERKYAEDEQIRQFDAVTVDVPLGDRQAKPQYYILRIIEQKKEQDYQRRWVR
ncbi:MAG: hypothetical protein Q7J54_05660 [Candidatus Woesearchaeota archaeon]|nr:hypothetical protein [Candidatus Woesearchaeota archaeon]